MIRCGKCGRTNVSGVSKCVGCDTPFAVAGPAGADGNTPGPRLGSPLRAAHARSVTPGPVKNCPACRATITPGFQFCGTCGTPVATASSTAPPPSFSGGPAPRPGPLSSHSTGARARVVVLAPDGTTLHVAALTSPITTVGTKGTVRLTDPYVADIHARLTFRANGLFVEPEATLNGVFALVKGDAPLAAGNELRLGRQLLRLEAFPNPPPVPEPVWGSAHPPYPYRFVQLLQGGVEGDVFPLKLGDNLIGRAAGDVSFSDDGYVSSRHAIVSVADDQVILRDIGSSNGTFIRLTGEEKVEPGDLLLFGEQLLRIEAP